VTAATDPPAPILDVADIDAAYDKATVLVGASLRVMPGDLLALCGPNGSGKSTLLRIMSRLMAPAAGRVLLHDQPLPDLSRKALARKLAMMPQSPNTPPSITVRELVGYGRSPHTSWLNPTSARDRDIIHQALTTCDLHNLADRAVDTLSGGERQRAWLAMAIAQQPDVLLLDEPVSALDVAHQLAVMRLLERINADRRTTIIIVLHDINLAARFCQSLALLRRGKLLAVGPMSDTLTDDNLRDTFGVPTTVRHLPDTDYPLCTFG